MRKNRFGLSIALATPFTEDRAIDLTRLVAHGRQSLADGCTSVAAFGTSPLVGGEPRFVDRPPSG